TDTEYGTARQNDTDLCFCGTHTLPVLERFVLSFRGGDSPASHCRSPLFQLPQLGLSFFVRSRQCTVPVS
ncbi:hypothetical protein C7212DRAFT_313333, partial [Tuber magnatum]